MSNVTTIQEVKDRMVGAFAQAYNAKPADVIALMRAGAGVEHWKDVGQNTLKVWFTFPAEINAAEPNQSRSVYVRGTVAVRRALES